MLNFLEELKETWKYGLANASSDKYETLGYYARVAESFQDAEVVRREEFVGRPKERIRFDKRSDVYHMSGTESAEYLRQNVDPPHGEVLTEYRFRVRGNGNLTVILDYTVHGVNTHRHIRFIVRPNGQP